jgi:hypothetical protein
VVVYAIKSQPLFLDVLVGSFESDSLGLPGESASLVRSVNVDSISCRLEKQFLILIWILLVTFLTSHAMLKTR